MKNNSRISSIAYVVVFVVVVILPGVISFVKLVDFYVNDEVDYIEWTADLGSQFETDIATCFLNKFEFVNFNGAIRNCLGQQQMNNVVKLDNGYLLSPIHYVSDEDLTPKVDAVVNLKRYLDVKEIPFIYVITPYTSSKYDPEVPVGIEDYGNDNLDRFAMMLENKDVNLMDLRETMYADGINQYDMMYKTDHHWTTKCGFYAYTKINEQLMDLLDCEVDPEVMDFSNYTVTTYDKWHLGSNGQRTGKYFAGIDDFDLIIPNFETSLVRYDEDEDLKEGEYAALIIDVAALQNRNPASRYTYDRVLEYAMSAYTNNNAVNDKKILVISDSYGLAVNPFLILSYQGVQTCPSGVISECLEDYKPDAVIMLLYASNAVSNTSYADSFYDFDLSIE